VAYNELIQFPHDITGLALNLEEDNVGAVILGECSKIKEGDEVKATEECPRFPWETPSLEEWLTP